MVVVLLLLVVVAISAPPSPQQFSSVYFTTRGANLFFPSLSLSLYARASQKGGG